MIFIALALALQPAFGAFPFSFWKTSASGSSLLTGLSDYWKLNEVSGTRADSTANAQTLTDNNTVTSNPGHVSTPAAQFTAANSET